MIIPVLIVVIAAGLLSSSGTADSTSTGSAPQAATAASNATGPSGKSGEAPGESSQAASAEPQVPSPKGPQATSLEVEDLVAGSGPEAKKGDEVEVHYLLFLRKSGKEIDSSWKRGEPYSFELGGGKVTAGWEQGIEGMKVGGRREIVAPGSLSYGTKGQPPTIGPNETLVSVIDLLAVK